MRARPAQDAGGRQSRYAESGNPIEIAATPPLAVINRMAAAVPRMCRCRACAAEPPGPTAGTRCVAEARKPKPIQPTTSGPTMTSTAQREGARPNTAVRAPQYRHACHEPRHRRNQAADREQMPAWIRGPARPSSPRYGRRTSPSARDPRTAIAAPTRTRRRRARARSLPRRRSNQHRGTEHRESCARMRRDPAADDGWREIAEGCRGDQSIRSG